MASGTEPQKFSGASKYVLDEELAKIINISMSLEMAGECTSCLMASCDRYQVIYTRRRN